MTAADPAVGWRAVGERNGHLWLGLAGALGAAGVLAGTFGAHGLRGRVDAHALEIFETGVRYHLVHAVALLGVAWAADRIGGRLVAAAGWSLVAGILLFSGSLYALALTGARALGAVTPFGGVALLAGWALLAAAAWRSRDAA